MKDSFYKEMECVFNKFPKYHMKILLGHFNVKLVREDVFEPTIRNESLHKINNDNGQTLQTSQPLYYRLNRDPPHHKVLIVRKPQSDNHATYNRASHEANDGITVSTLIINDHTVQQNRITITSSAYF
jgi:hypothetical protein